MNRIVNDPNFVVEDMLKGFVKNHKDLVEKTENDRVLKYKKAPMEGKVGIVTGGGSGHKPAFIGYIGENLCDAVAVGEIFSSPTAKAFLDAIKAADSGKGVACLYGNYAGDNMNVKMAMRKAKKLGIEVKTVVANDDCASAPKGELDKRRGVAGEVLMWKVGGAKAAMGGFAAYNSVPGLGSVREVFFDPINSLVEGTLTKEDWVASVKAASDQMRANLVG